MLANPSNLLPSAELTGLGLALVAIQIRFLAQHWWLWRAARQDPPWPSVPGRVVSKRLMTAIAAWPTGSPNSSATVKLEASSTRGVGGSRSVRRGSIPELMRKRFSKTIESARWSRSTIPSASRRKTR